jgi:hypothetical protein
VVDRSRVTGGGVTAGIDLGLVMASQLCSAAVAREIQLMIEYDPVPFHAAESLTAAPAGVAQRFVRERQRVQSDRRAIAKRAAARLEHMTGAPNEPSLKSLGSPPTCGHETLEGFALRATSAEGVDITSLAPGTTLIVHTRNSHYRLVRLLDPPLVLVQGGSGFAEATVVRLQGATAGGRTLKTGWILVGFHMEMWHDSTLVTSSRVCSISVQEVRPLRPRAMQ